MFIHLIKKDLKRFLRDRSALITLIAMPIVITTILGFALQSMFSLGDSNGIDKVNFALVDEDQSQYSLEQFTKDLANNPMGAGMLQSGAMEAIAANYEKLSPRKIFFEDFLGSKEIAKMVSYKTMSLEEAKTAMKANEVAGIVILSEDFSKNMTINLLTTFRNEVAITLLPNDNMTMSSMILKALMGGFVEQINSVVNQKNVSIEQQIQYDLIFDFAQIGTEAKAVNDNQGELRATTINGTKPIDSKGYYAIAMMAMFLMFVAAMGGSMMLEEKDLYTYDRHLMAGLGPVQIVIGKMSVIALVAALQIGIMILYGRIVFGVDWGSILNLLLISAVTIFAVSGLGILLCIIGLVTKSYQISRIFENGLIQVLALFGGSYLPVEQMPQVIQTLSQFVLNGVILKAYLFNMMGYSLEQLKPYLFAIGLNGLIFMGLAAVLYIVKEVGTDVAHTQTEAVDAA